MSFVAVLLLGILAIVIVTVIGIVVVARRQGPAIMAARRAFFEQTGYRHPQLPDGSVDDQVCFVPPMKLSSREERYVRRVDGHELHFHASSAHEAGAVVRRMSWSIPLHARSHAELQIADRSLSSFGKAAKEALTGSTRSWAAIYPGPVPLGDAELDARFVAFAPDPTAVQRWLATPGVRALLLACAEVDLVVGPDAIRFSDPSDRNMRASRGGTSGRIALGTAESIAASVPVHRRITDLLERTYRAVAS